MVDQQDRAGRQIAAQDLSPDDRDPIAAVATAPGRAAIGIVRVSGADLKPLMAALGWQRPPPPRRALLRQLQDADGEPIDQALALYFPAPDSYTGEDMLELQGHGNPLVLERLLDHLGSLGVRPARAGEFSFRAFLNGKMDLTRAEAVADLIAASSEAAVRGALRSLQGAFAERIEALCERLTALRVQLESDLDFPAEELDTADQRHLCDETAALLAQVRDLGQSSEGSLALSEGLQVALIGRPNTGKSSLFNALAGRDLAIVSDQAGTTRDLLPCRLTFDGATLELTDAAGLRAADSDAVEREGVARSLHRAEEADLLLVVCDCDNPLPPEQARQISGQTLHIVNKIDLCERDWQPPPGAICVSALTGAGLDELKRRMAAAAGVGEDSETDFLARRRHLHALEEAAESLQRAQQSLAEGIGEMAAEQLRDARQALAAITGEVSGEELLDRIFTTFCIGK